MERTLACPLLSTAYHMSDCASLNLSAPPTDNSCLCLAAGQMQESLHKKLLQEETNRGPLLRTMASVYQCMSQAGCAKNIRHRWQEGDLKYFTPWLPHNGTQRWRSLFPKTPMDPIAVGPLRAKVTTEYWQRSPLLSTEERRALIQLIAAFDHPKAVDWLVSAQHEETDKFLLGDISYALVGHNVAEQAVFDSLKQVFASQSSPEDLSQQLQTLVALAVLGSPDTLTLAKELFLTPRVNPLALRLAQEAALLALYYQGGEAAWTAIEELSHQQDLHPQTVRWIEKLSYLHQGTRVYLFTDSISKVLHLLEDGPGGPLDLRWSDQGIVEMAQPLPRDPMTLAYFTHRLQRTDLPTSYRMTAARIIAPYRHYESIHKIFETLAIQEQDDELAEFAKKQAAPPTDSTSEELSCSKQASPTFWWPRQDEKIPSDLDNPDPQSRGSLPQSHVTLEKLDRSTAGSVWEEVLKLPPPFTNRDLKLLITAPQPMDDIAWRSQSDAFYFTLSSIARDEAEVFLGSEGTETVGNGLFKSVSLVFVHNPETTSTQWEVDIYL